MIKIMRFTDIESHFCYKLPTGRSNYMFHSFIQKYCMWYHYRAAVFISHGVGEHSGRYEDLGTFLKDHRIAVHSHDHSKCCLRYKKSRY